MRASFLIAVMFLYFCSCGSGGSGDGRDVPDGALEDGGDDQPEIEDPAAPDTLPDDPEEEVEVDLDPADLTDAEDAAEDPADEEMGQLDVADRDATDLVTDATDVGDGDPIDLDLADEEEQEMGQQTGSPLPCTGQTTCYDGSAALESCPADGAPFCGQDAQYAGLDYCEPFDFTFGGTAPEEVVTDSHTGLMWQRTLPVAYEGCSGSKSVGESCSWTEAVAYCDGLSYAGHEDWRLPRARELESILFYGEVGAAIDPDAFPGASGGMFWTSTARADNPDVAWYVNFASGDLFSFPKTFKQDVRCVRGEVFEPLGEFAESTVGEDVIVADAATGLTWAQGSSGSLSWAGALSYCESLEYADRDDWRLPNITELRTLVDRQRHSPASLFPGMPESITLLSSTTSPAGATHASGLMLDDGAAGHYSKSVAGFSALCVRGVAGGGSE
ncbi:MAG: DUF1566 domain-containing protein [Bradymonadales bacterium]|nr:DUF1566 domain-containing protein [Bradymonadales bacterium]